MKTSLRSLDPKIVRQASLGLAGALLLVAAYLGWTGWQQHQAQQARASVAQAQEALVRDARKQVDTAVSSLAKQASLPAVGTMAVSGNLAGAAAAMQPGLKGAKEVAVFGRDLTALYEQDKPAYAQLMALETALRDNAGFAVAMPEGSTTVLAVGAPVQVQGRTVAVAYAQFPAKALVDAVTKAGVDDAGYLGLMQGSVALSEQGDKQLSTRPEADTTRVPKSSLAIVSATPAEGGSPMGAWGLAAALAALAAGLAALPKLMGRGRVISEPPVVVHAPIAAPPSIEPDVVAETVPVAAPVVVEVPADPGEALFVHGVAPGTVEASFEPEHAVRLGRVIGGWLHSEGIGSVVVGRDARASSQALLSGLIQGLVEAGRSVRDAGHAPTPLVAYAAGLVGAGASIAVVGSARTITHTGLLVSVAGKYLTTEELDAMVRSVQPHQAEGGSCETIEPDNAYVQQLAEVDAPPRRVVVGVSGEHAELLTRALERMGVFVSDAGDAEAFVSLGDNGSSVSVLDGQSQPVSPSRVLMALAEDRLGRAPGGEVIGDAAMVDALATQVLVRGGVMRDEGPDLTHIQAATVERGAMLAGDSLGHVIVPERGFTVADGLLACVKLVELLGFVDHADEILRAQE